MSQRDIMISSRTRFKRYNPLTHLTWSFKPNSIEPRYFELNSTSGIVGQIEARKALAAIINGNDLEDVMGKSILLAGVFSLGKTAFVKV